VGEVGLGRSAGNGQAIIHPVDAGDVAGDQYGFFAGRGAPDAAGQDRGIAIDLDPDPCVVAAVTGQVLFDRGFALRIARLEDLLAGILHEIKNTHG